MVEIFAQSRVFKSKALQILCLNLLYFLLALGCSEIYI